MSYYFFTHICLRKKKLIKDVHSGVHRLRMPIIDSDGFAEQLGSFQCLHHPARFPQDFHRVILCYNCSIQRQFQRRVGSVMVFAIILITVILKSFTKNMLSFYCIDNLILDVPFWTPRAQFSKYLTLYSTLSSEHAASLIFFHFSSGSSVPLSFWCKWQLRLIGKEGYKI